MSYHFALEGDELGLSYPFGGAAVATGAGGARVCDNRRIPTSATVQPLTAGKLTCSKASAFGVDKPFDIVSKAVSRALEMLDNTIEELVSGRNKVCNGEPPAWPLFSDMTLLWLRDRLGVCVDDIKVWTAGTFVIGSVAEVIRHLMQIRNLIASGGLRYTCSDRCDPADPKPVCDPDVWAFVCGNIPLIHFCQAFWKAKGGVDPKVHAEFQAQTIIHEVSHLYYNTEDYLGSGLGVAECIAQFVAATNGGPLDPGFNTRCTVSKRCPGTVRDPATLRYEVAGLGVVTPGVRIVKTSFRPQGAVRLKGRKRIRS